MHHGGGCGEHTWENFVVWRSSPSEGKLIMFSKKDIRYSSLSLNQDNDVVQTPCLVLQMLGGWEDGGRRQSKVDEQNHMLRASKSYHGGRQKVKWTNRENSMCLFTVSHHKHCKREKLCTLCREHRLLTLLLSEHSKASSRSLTLCILRL